MLRAFFSLFTYHKGDSETKPAKELSKEEEANFVRELQELRNKYYNTEQ